MRAITGFIAIYILAIAALAVGWIMNIFTIIHLINEPVTNMMILRWVGIFVAPLGGILGYM